MSISRRLEAAGVVLPNAAPAAANYVPTVLHGGLLYIAGQIPFDGDGQLMRGCVGADADLAFGIEAARRCAVALLAQMQAALGDLERVERVLKLGVFVNCAPAFTDHPKVGNGASDLIVEILGDAGRHARSAVGVASLPLGVAVEIDAVVAVRAD